MALLSHEISRGSGKDKKKKKQPLPQNLAVRLADRSSSSQHREPWQQGSPQLGAAHPSVLLLSPDLQRGEENKSEQRGFSCKCV